MPRYRVGDRVFETEGEADAHRASTPDAPATFVEPDVPAPAVDAYAALQRTGGGSIVPQLAWIVAAVWLTADIGLHILFVQLVLGGHAPHVTGAALFGYALRLVSVWRMTSVLSRPTAYSRGAVVGAAALAFVALLSLASGLVSAVRLVRAYEHRREDVSVLNATPPPPEPPYVPVAAPAFDAGPPPPQRAWAAFASADGHYAVSFPGAPITRDHEARVDAEDGAVFDVLYRPAARGAPPQPPQRTTAEELAALVRRTGATMLDQGEHYDEAERLAERTARLGLASPPRILYARIVTVRGETWVTTAELPAGQPDRDASAFLESFTLAQ